MTPRRMGISRDVTLGFGTLDYTQREAECSGILYGPTLANSRK